MSFIQHRAHLLLLRISRTLPTHRKGSHHSGKVLTAIFINQEDSFRLPASGKLPRRAIRQHLHQPTTLMWIHLLGHLPRVTNISTFPHTGATSRHRRIHRKQVYICLYRDNFCLKAPRHPSSLSHIRALLVGNLPHLPMALAAADTCRLRQQSPRCLLPRRGDPASTNCHRTAAAKSVLIATQPRHHCGGVSLPL